ncbi:MAG: Gfo/Idh/MocA family oxidoreductase [Candidatus Latescibacteria bacterium]|nr:Gfo/Idh/MocA family oxidoreductase [Candidatus Latescibacterota bacterium]
MAKYRAGVIGLGWMGLLYDLAERIPDLFDVDDVDRPTPELNVHRRFYHHDHPGTEGNPTTYAEALHSRPEVELAAAADRDPKRLAAFTERYGIRATYTDAEAMLRAERPDIVAVATNTKGRADLTCLAVAHGARGIVTDKPMCHTLEEADRMVSTCAEAGVPLSCGAITTTHPSFGKARELVQSGAIGKIRSIEADSPFAQHQNWSYFLDSPPAWVSGIGDLPRRGAGTDEFDGPGGSDEFRGQGIMVTADRTVVHFRAGAPGVRLEGSTGEIRFEGARRWRLRQQLETTGNVRVEMPWPEPQFVYPYGAVYSLNDVIDCMEGRLDEPKNSGRRIAVALEVEIALKLSSARGGERVAHPLEDRSLGLNYDWFR